MSKSFSSVISQSKPLNTHIYIYSWQSRGLCLFSPRGSFQKSPKRDQISGQMMKGMIRSRCSDAAMRNESADASGRDTVTEPVAGHGFEFPRLLLRGNSEGLSNVTCCFLIGTSQLDVS